MALHGVNTPMALNGVEQVWMRVLTSEDFGLKESEVEEWFGDPAHQAWARNGAAQGSWTGGRPKKWLKRQWDLQCDAVKLMRDFGMTPVLPGFNGHVPPAIARRFPEAKLRRVENWLTGETTVERDHRERERPATTEEGGKAHMARDGDDSLARLVELDSKWSEHEVHHASHHHEEKKEEEQEEKEERTEVHHASHHHDEKKEEEKEEESNTPTWLSASRALRRRRRRRSSARRRRTTPSGPFTSSTRATRCSNPRRRLHQAARRGLWHRPPLPGGHFPGDSRPERRLLRVATWHEWARRRSRRCARRTPARRGCSSRTPSTGTPGSGTRVAGGRCFGRLTSETCSCSTARRKRIRTTFASQCTSPGSRSCGA